jgi:hypothetical protein
MKIKQLALLGMTVVLMGGCTTDVSGLSRALQGTSQAVQGLGTTMREGTRGMNGYTAPAPAVTFDQPQPAAQQNVRTVWIDAGNGRQRYSCTGTGANTRCWQ